MNSVFPKESVFQSAIELRLKRLGLQVLREWRMKFPTGCGEEVSHVRPDLLAGLPSWECCNKNSKRCSYYIECKREVTTHSMLSAIGQIYFAQSMIDAESKKSPRTKDGIDLWGYAILVPRSELERFPIWKHFADISGCFISDEEEGPRLISEMIWRCAGVGERVLN